MLMDLSLSVSQQTYFQQDGIPAYNSTRVMDHSINQFNGRVIVTNGLVCWPAVHQNFRFFCVI